ncbi:MAG: glycosyltransferase [Magnetococcales bacterium]|nr:glycosyltransferase [Magnetococcales bacterium]
MFHPFLSIIAPTLNEEAALGPLLEDVARQRGVEWEGIVADGGSEDGTRSLAADRENWRWLDAPRGRGAQLNAGARLARGEWLLFLHADSRLTSPTLLADALHALEQARAETGNPRIAGHFPLRFIRRQPRSDTPGEDFSFRLHEAKTRLNRRGCLNGDQGMLLSRSTFDALGGFDESLPFLEDQTLADRLFDEGGAWIALPGRIWSSARRFESEGMRQRMILAAVLMGLREAGVREFLEQAPGLYREQKQTGRLRLTPFRQTIQRLNAEAPPAERRRRWRAVGRYVRRNAWQLFFARDVRRGSATESEARWLAFHDRWFAPAFEAPWADGLTALGTRLWFEWGFRD